MFTLIIYKTANVYYYGTDWWVVIQDICLEETICISRHIHSDITIPLLSNICIHDTRPSVLTQSNNVPTSVV